MPNEDGTPTTDELLNDLLQKVDLMQSSIDTLNKFSSATSATFACCNEMCVTVACKPHDTTVVYPKWATMVVKPDEA